MTSVRRSRLAIVCIVLGSLLGLLPRAAEAQPAHLVWAMELVSNLSPGDNEYEGSPSYVTWAGVDGATRYANRTLCGGFVTSLLKHAYGFTEDDLQSWFGSRGPNPSVYYGAIAAENGFERIMKVDAILPGDIMAIRYPDGSSSSGHIGIVRAAPKLRASTSPLVPGTYQFEISVIDSTSSVHGVWDSRVNRDGTRDAGAGTGSMRLYVDGALNIVGHSWSISSGSAFRGVSSYPLAVGRLL